MFEMMPKIAEYANIVILITKRKSTNRVLVITETFVLFFFTNFIH